MLLVVVVVARVVGTEALPSLSLSPPPNACWAVVVARVLRVGLVVAGLRAQTVCLQRQPARAQEVPRTRWRFIVVSCSACVCYNSVTTVFLTLPCLFIDATKP